MAQRPGCGAQLGGGHPAGPPARPGARSDAAAGPSPHGTSARVGAADRGSVTAELAIALPAVVLVLVTCLAVGVAAIGQIRCADAARAGARAAAIGEDLAVVRATAVDLAGEGASVAVEQTGVWTVVRVRRPLALRGWMTAPLVAQAEARAWTEPSATGTSVRGPA